jgi:hypothetical protein
VLANAASAYKLVQVQTQVLTQSLDAMDMRDQFDDDEDIVVPKSTGGKAVKVPVRDLVKASVSAKTPGRLGGIKRKKSASSSEDDSSDSDSSSSSSGRSSQESQASSKIVEILEDSDSMQQEQEVREREGEEEQEEQEEERGEGERGEEEGGEQEEREEGEGEREQRDPCELLELLKTTPVDDDISLTLRNLGEVFNELHARWTVVSGEEEKEGLWADPIRLACQRYGGSIVHMDKSNAADPIAKTMVEMYDERTLEETHVDKATKMEQFALIQLSYAFTVEDLISGNEETSAGVDLAEVCGDTSELLLKLDRVGRAILSNKQLLLGFLATVRSHGGTHDLGAPKIFDPNAYDIFDRSSKFSPYQELLLYVLRELRKANLRRSHDNKLVMRPLLTKPMLNPSNGEMQRFNTCSWVPLTTEKGTPMGFSDFVASRIDKRIKMDMWKAATQANNLERLAKYLETCEEEELPTLNSGRSHISFSNGVLELATCTLHEYPIKNASSIMSMNYIDLDCPRSEDISLQTLIGLGEEYNPSWYKRDPETGRKFKNAEERAARIAAKSKIDWENLMLTLEEIPTPTLDSIFDMQLDNAACGYWKGVPADEYQNKFDEIKFWHFAMLGRLLYEVGDRENWQVIQFLKGKAGSGKSTLCKLVGWFFRHEDVGYLGNQMRGGGKSVGGLADVYKSKVWLVTEVDTNFGLERTTFQSIVCGENVLIDQLYGKTLNWTWKSHGMLAGNKFFGYRDTSGSITRRVLVTDFDRTIPEAAKDPEMEKKLKLELPQIIYKCSLSYLYLTELFRGCDIWSIVPDYFTWTKEKLTAHIDPMGSFISSLVRSGKLIKDKTNTRGMLWSALRELFIQSDFKKDLKPHEYKEVQNNDFQQIGPMLGSLKLELLEVTERTFKEAELLLENGGEGDLSKWTKKSQDFFIVKGIFVNPVAE